jgi:hypothetical protein
VTFDHVKLLDHELLGIRCQVGGHVVWIGSLQCQPGTTVHLGRGDGLVPRRADAAELGLIDWKPAA